MLQVGIEATVTYWYDTSIDENYEKIDISARENELLSISNRQQILKPMNVYDTIIQSRIWFK